MILAQPNDNTNPLDLTEASRAMGEFIAREVGFDGGPAMFEQACDAVQTVFPHIANALADRIKAEADECHKTQGGGFPAGLEIAAEMLRDLASGVSS